MTNNIQLNGVEVSVEDALAALREKGTVTFEPDPVEKVFLVDENHQRVKVIAQRGSCIQVHVKDCAPTHGMTMWYARELSECITRACDWAEGKKS